MISPKYIFLLFVGCMALVWACRPSASTDRAAADITEALENDNVDAARSKADAFFASGVKLDTVAVRQLCMLSVTLAKLSESGDHSDDFAAQALQCYRVAMRRDSVAALSFYEELSPDDFKYFNLLKQLGGRVDARDAGIRANEEGGDYVNLSEEHGHE